MHYSYQYYYSIVKAQGLIFDSQPRSLYMVPRTLSTQLCRVWLCRMCWVSGAFGGEAVTTDIVKSRAAPEKKVLETADMQIMVPKKDTKGYYFSCKLVLFNHQPVGKGEGCPVAWSWVWLEGLLLSCVQHPVQKKLLSTQIIVIAKTEIVPFFRQWPVFLFLFFLTILILLVLIFISFTQYITF